ncbi:hypothetical protein ACLMJK_009416 [Lecanora helva]
MTSSRETPRELISDNLPTHNDTLLGIDPLAIFGWVPTRPAPSIDEIRGRHRLITRIVVRYNDRPEFPTLQDVNRARDAFITPARRRNRATGVESVLSGWQYVVQRTKDRYQPTWSPDADVEDADALLAMPVARPSVPITPQRPREVTAAGSSSPSMSSLSGRKRHTNSVHHGRNRSDSPSTTPSTGHRTRSPLRSTPSTAILRHVSFDLDVDGLEITGEARRARGPVVRNAAVKKEKQVEVALHEAAEDHQEMITISSDEDEGETVTLETVDKLEGRVVIGSDRRTAHKGNQVVIRFDSNHHAHFQSLEPVPDWPGRFKVRRIKYDEVIVAPQVTTDIRRQGNIEPARAVPTRQQLVDYVNHLSIQRRMVGWR